MKRETIVTLAPSSLRNVANYVLLFTDLERKSAPEGVNTGTLDRLQASARTILRDTSKRRLAMPKVTP